ncbi:MAG: arginyltransferase [Pseudomonadota bacterium]
MMDFYQTPIHPCGYLPNRYSVNIFADPNTEISTRTYSWLIDHGFRRNGNHLYRPHCPDCKACVPTRVAVDHFKPSRSQKRILARNKDIDIQVIEKQFKQVHFDLYKRYLEDRHNESPMTTSSQQDYEEFILGSWSDTLFLEFRLEEKLICVAVYDYLPQGLSAAYTYFDTAYQNRSLGKLAVLKLIEQAQLQNLEYVYLGYWIKECQKMSYKTNFAPTEGFLNKQWQVIEAEK